MTQVVLASNNPGKLKEFSASLAAAGIEMVPQGALGVPEAEEPFGTFVENALTKARHASRVTGLPALADDSGLCVRALGGAPGVHSARYAATADGARSDAANNARLVADMAGREDRRGCYVAVLVYIRSADDPRPIVVEGTWDGEVLAQPRGANGFGYDPYFYLPDLGMTAAELPLEQKNQLSHRARALRQLLQALRSEYAGPRQS
ncbi:RdgB/HAM1 family non-canonical purine NTP pyrophosphatase [uncultured Castellaniella sp.]|uniref:RdgB/HAM1 family non-canonical purine NTP pyrophosphatase n=1 Tax=uncultured Castellaniella sp. TaxID=647907 RepID=UPI00263329CE|nr:RdgB/HAM1 family non-canonical purine NTP pyrophosphatase [uncultured Castellaniella sp.]